MKASELKSKSSEDLQKDLLSLLEEQFKLRMQNATGQLSRPHMFKKLRRETLLPLWARPRLRPFICFRNFVLFGCNIFNSASFYLN